MTREKAIKIVKEFINGTCLHLVDQEALETLIPELAESEDERIRKEMLAFFKKFYETGTWNAISDCKEWIAYLERQKERKPISFYGHYNPDDYEVVMEGNATSLKQKEQKPAEWSDGNNILEDIIVFVSGYADKRVVTKWVSFLKSLRPQPKQEWSEEDENKLHQVMETLLADKTVALRETPHCKALHQAYDEMLIWLKSLPLNLKKKNEDVAKLCSNEWSEEDEININLIISYLDAYINEHDNSFGADECKGLKYWLKSLHPSWKPSEELLTTLLRAEGIASIYGTKELAAAIAQLYEQLKKTGVKEEPEYYQHFDPDC